MKYLIALALSLLLSGTSFAGIVEERVEYKDGNAALEGFLVYDDSLAGPRPGVIVFHEWWGLNDYVMSRSRQLASLGYAAFAADVYGKGIRPTDREAAGKEAGKYMKDRPLMRSRVSASLAALKKSSLVRPDSIAAIGYCFGGAAALELGKSGAPVSAIVTFHGALNTPTPEDARNIKASVLVLHGGADPYVKPAEVQSFQESMDKAGVDWQFTSYGGAVHGFTNPGNGTDPTDGLAYQEKADRRSWEAMKDFLSERLNEAR